MMKTIDQSTFTFLKDLLKNNNREWFNEHKPLYQAAQKNFIEVVDSVITAVSDFDDRVQKLEGKNCVFRIYRDARFSLDKTPYKTNMGASLVDKGTKTLNHAGYYIHLEPGKSFLAGGVYMTESINLKAIRTRISEEQDLFLSIINQTSFQSNLELRGEQLVRVPQGFSKDDKMADYLRYKQFTVFHTLTDQEVIADDFVLKATEIFREIHPFNQFLNNAIENI